jgi:hypothetical protein
MVIDVGDRLGRSCFLLRIGTPGALPRSTQRRVRAVMIVGRFVVAGDARHDRGWATTRPVRACVRSWRPHRPLVRMHAVTSLTAARPDPPTGLTCPRALDIEALHQIPDTTLAEDAHQVSTRVASSHGQPAQRCHRDPAPSGYATSPPRYAATPPSPTTSASPPMNPTPAFRRGPGRSGMRSCTAMQPSDPEEESQNQATTLVTAIIGTDARPAVRPHPDKGWALWPVDASSNVTTTSVSAGQSLCGAPRRNRTGDPILTMDRGRTAVLAGVFAARATP